MWPASWSRHARGQKRFRGQPRMYSRALSRLVGMQRPPMRTFLQNVPDRQN